MKKILILTLILLMAGCNRDPKATRDKYYKNAEKYLAEKKYEEAAIEFRNALRADNGHIASYMGLAKSLQQLDDQMGALAIFRRVSELDTKNVDAKLEMGRYILAAAVQNPELFKRAKDLAEEILKQDPANIEARILLGNAYAGLNDNTDSIRELEKALAGDPGNVSASLMRGVVEARSQQGDKAEQTFKETLEKHPDSLQARIALATFYASSGKMQEAESQFKQAFDRDPANTLCLYSLVRFYLANKNVPAAENVFREAIKRRGDAREPRWALANFLLMQGRVDEGMALLNALVKKNPEDRQAQLRIAEVYIGKGQPDEAQKIVGVLLKDNSSDAEAHFLQGRIFQGKGLRDKALEEYDAAIRHKDFLIPPYLLKASLLVDKNDLEGAKSALNEVLKRDRENVTAKSLLARVLSLGQSPQDAIETAEQVLRSTPGNVNALMARADGLRKLGKLEDAKKDYLELCKLQPQNPLFWHRLGLAEGLGGDTTAALTHLRKAVELKPDFIDAVNDILYMLMKTKQVDQALAELDRLSKGGTPKDEIHRFRGQVYLTKGDMAAGEAEFRKAIEVNPQSFQSYVLLSQLNRQRNNIPQAVKELDQLVAKNNKLPGVFLLRGSYLQTLNNIPAAMADYRKALELSPENPVASNNLAWLLCQTNTNLEEAVSLAKVAKKKFPDNPEIAETLGWAYCKTKNYTLAVDQLVFSVNNRKQPAAEHYYRLGMAYYGKGDLTLAKQTLRKSLEMDPKFSGADDARRVLNQKG